MDVTSLSFRTELALLRLGGSSVQDRGRFLVVRTPSNPTFHWGNFLLLERPPTDDELADWLVRFREEFPDARHVALGIDRPDLGDLAPLREAGWRVDMAVAMTATDVSPPPRPNADAELRALSSDADWSQQVDLTLAGEDDPHLTREFVGLRHESHRDLVESGHGRWWGGFVDGRLVSSMGLFDAGGGLARFQNVKTHPDHRNRGLAGSLVHAASRDALDLRGARTLVMVADPEYSAIRVYRSVGFADGGSHAEATLLPTRTD